MDEQFFTTKDLMQRWKCSYYAAACAMRSRAMRSIKISGKFKAKLSDIERYEKQMVYRPEVV